MISKKGELTDAVPRNKVNLIACGTLAQVRSLRVNALFIDPGTWVFGALVLILITLCPGPSCVAHTAGYRVTCQRSHTTITLIGTVDTKVEIVTVCEL